MFISIVIPTYNEGKRISGTLESIISFLQKKDYTYEIIIVDDGSTDLTVKKVEEIKSKNPEIKIIQNEVNLGKGYSVKRGVLAAEGEYIFFTDADLSTPIEELEKFFTEIKNHNIVIGSRAIKGANIVVHQPIYREILGKIFCKLVRLWCGVDFIDTQCGAKMFRKNVAKKIFSLQKISRFAFDVEILYLAKLSNYQVKEIPIIWSHSGDSRVHTFSDGIKMLIDLMKIKFIHRNTQLE